MFSYNSNKTRYCTIGIGPHWERRFEVYEKTAFDGEGWSLRFWTTNAEAGKKYWESIKDEPIKDDTLPWIDFD